MTTGNTRTITAVFLPAGLLFFWYNIYEGWDTDRRGLAQDWIGNTSGILTPRETLCPGAVAGS